RQASAQGVGAGRYDAAGPCCAPILLRAALSIRDYIEREARQGGIEGFVRVANVVGIAQFKRGVRTRAVVPGEFQVRLGGVEPNCRRAKIRGRSGYYARSTADIEHALTGPDARKL